MVSSMFHLNEKPPYSDTDAQSETHSINQINHCHIRFTFYLFSSVSTDVLFVYVFLHSPLRFPHHIRFYIF